MSPRIATVVMLLIAACSSSGQDAPASANVVFPSNDVLCQVFAGNVPGDRFELRTYGSLSTDVVEAWGEPAERNGDVWVYEWCIGDCARKATVTLTFEQADLCYSGGKRISGLFVADIEAEGIAGQRCWDSGLRMDEETCAGCLNDGDVSQCL